VLKQINVPHPYYFREMYLPQLTTGPSSVSWWNNNSLIYSKRGSLWVQDISLDFAEQLTAGPDYDYQPDASPDGKWLVFSRYDGKSIELDLMDVVKGTITRLTNNGAVNLEARWSPDGERIAFVSTSFEGRWHVFTMDVQMGMGACQNE
jgi:Periplasmic component of the Tol biopolymer transport system